jgi:hypothetical protein
VRLEAHVWAREELRVTGFPQERAEQQGHSMAQMAGGRGWLWRAATSCAGAPSCKNSST